MRAGYGVEFRNYLTTKTNPKLLIDFGETHVFESATVMTNILLFHNAENSNSIISTQIKDDFIDPSTLTEYVSDHHMICQFEGDESWVIMSDLIRNLKKKVEAKGKPLGDWGIDINYGIKTGFNQAFFITSEQRNAILDNCKDEQERKRTEKLILKLLRGKDIRKYGYQWADLWMINTHNGVRGKIERIHIEDYPAVKEHLDHFWDRLARRADKGDTPYNLRNCAYLESFFKPKIIYPEITKYMPFYYEEDDVITTNTCYVLSGNHLSYLTAFLNSSLFKFCFKENFAVLFGGARRMLKMYIEKLPVMDVSDEVDAEFRKLVLDIQQDYSDEKAKVIDQRIFDLYELTQEERDAIGYIDFHNNDDNEPDEDE